MKRLSQGRVACEANQQLSSSGFSVLLSNLTSVTGVHYKSTGFGTRSFSHSNFNPQAGKCFSLAKRAGKLRSPMCVCGGGGGGSQATSWCWFEMGWQSTVKVDKRWQGLRDLGLRQLLSTLPGTTEIWGPSPARGKWGCRAPPRALPSSSGLAGEALAVAGPLHPPPPFLSRSPPSLFWLPTPPPPLSPLPSAPSLSSSRFSQARGVWS